MVLLGPIQLNDHGEILFNVETVDVCVVGSVHDIYVSNDEFGDVLCYSLGSRDNILSPEVTRQLNQGCHAFVDVLHTCLLVVTFANESAVEATAAVGQRGGRVALLVDLQCSGLVVEVGELRTHEVTHALPVAGHLFGLRQQAHLGSAVVLRRYAHRGCALLLAFFLQELDRTALRWGRHSTIQYVLITLA